RPAAERCDIGVGLQRSGAGDHAGDPVAVRDQPLDSGVELELHPEPRGLDRERLRKHVAIAGLVLRQPQPAEKLVLYAPKRGLGGNAAVAVEHFIGNAILLEYRNVAAGAVELFLL